MLSLQNKVELSTIAQMAYGHGFNEGVAGGEGRMGIVDGRVVKFNTSWKDRWFGAKADDKMLKSCDELRSRLLDIAKNNGLDQNAMAAIRKQLGLSDRGLETSARKLLDRKAVAKVVNMIAGQEAKGIWSGIDQSRTMKSSGDMSFAAVSQRTAAHTAPFRSLVEDGIKCAFQRHFPGLKLLADDVSALVDGMGGNKLMDHVKRCGGTPFARDLIDEILAGVRKDFEKMLGKEQALDDVLDDEYIALEAVMREVGDLIEATQMNPTGTQVTVEESEQVADEAIELMHEDLHKQGMPETFVQMKDLDFHQMDLDLGRSFDYVVGGKRFDCGKDADVDGFHKALAELFKKSDGNVDIHALNVAVGLAHQGLATVGHSGSVGLKLPFVPAQCGADLGTSTQTITIEKSQKPGRYVIAYSFKRTAFEYLVNVAIERVDPMNSVIKLQGNNDDNYYSMDYSLEFGVEDGEIVMEMLTTPTQKLDLPVQQQLVYGI